MIAGTGSDVGKSLIAAGLCRILRQDGFNPAPFKAQNMALNSAATPDGREIGRAQAVQAEAAGIPAEVDMNPLLLKPSGERTSQVILLGRPIGNRDAYTWYRNEGREVLRREVHQAFDRLAERFNPIVLEGAGSIAELNLAATDLVNMDMARYADADILLVADIDRGGVFAAAYGSIMLQTPDDRRRIRGVIVNKFRGDLRLFEQGRKILEEICGVPVLGVVPMADDIHIDEEDSVSLAAKPTAATADGRVNIAVVRLPRISNFTDFAPLERDPRLNLYYTDTPGELARADMIIIPGSKATIADLTFLRTSGLDRTIQTAASEGKPVVGICGGYQMMGRSVADPDGIEGMPGEVAGLALLDIATTLTAEKITRPMTFTFRPADIAGCRGYEIHQGRTTLGPTATPLLTLADGTADGAMAAPTIAGSYLHGFFDTPAIVDHFLSFLPPDLCPAPLSESPSAAEDEYDRLASHLRQYLDIQQIYNILSRND